MSALFRIVYAAHANGTHHKLALDGLNHMQRSDAEGWRRVMLKHVEKYLEGSKAPDNTFKDFKNHVLHVGDNYWGGAPEKVAEWYGKTVAALQAGQWAEAAYAAGVLSHYYTDPIMPFHTGQTEAENAIHRATEWSINRSYNTLRKLGEDRYGLISVERHDGDDWLKQMTCDGAETAHRYYEKLIAHYDIHRGVVAPEEGLDSISQTFIAELLIYAAEGFGRILDRAVADAAVPPPDVALTLETFLATLKIPSKWIEKKLANAEDRKLVQAMYDELKATGRVEATLPEDDRTIRDLHAAEVLAPKLAKRATKRAERMPAAPEPQAERKFAAAVNSAATPAVLSAPPPPPKAQIAPAASAPRYQPELEPTRAAPPAHAAAAPAVSEPIAHINPDPRESAEDRRCYLSPGDPLEDAPSIGPKMAARFASLGIMTVADFLGHEPHDMAELLDDDRIDGETLTDWQDQAQLVIDIAGLRGGGAQLLVGAGYRSARAIAEADAVDLSADVLTFAASSEGKRILRDGQPPALEKIKQWVTSAQQALAA